MKYAVVYSTLMTPEKIYSKHHSYKAAKKKCYWLNGVGQGLIAKVIKLKN